MAAGRISAPGTEYGPCDPPCEHIDCAADREEAATPCCICDEPIGYETSYYRDPAGENERRDPDGAWYYTHRSCHLEAQERIARAGKILGARL